MSNINEFFTQIQNNIKESEDFRRYRKKVVNTFYQSLSISKPVLQKEISNILKKLNIADKNIAKEAAEVMYNEILANLKNKETIIQNIKVYYGNTPKLKDLGLSLEKSLQEVILTPRGKTACRITLKGYTNNKDDLFRILQDAKREGNKKAIKKIQELVKLTENINDIKSVETLQTGNFIDLTHQQKGSVVDIFGLEQLKLIENYLADRKIYKTEEDKVFLTEVITQLKSILKVSSGRVTKTVRITLGEANLNRKLGATTQKELRKAYLSILNEAIEKINPTAITKVESSDSYETIVRKTILNSFKRKLSKNIRTNFKVYQINKPNNKTITKSIDKFSSSKGTFKEQPTKIISGVAPLINLEVSKAPSVLEILAYINSKLPQTVEKNMVLPALESRTGRFANSVKVLNMVQTRKGFPSFEYTYDKNPYQVFEMGLGRSPWSTVDRDPRKLIDKSIREIAAELLQGRLFTRRV